MLFKLSNLNSNLALNLGYLNPALNNSALQHIDTYTDHPSSSQLRPIRLGLTKVSLFHLRFPWFYKTSILRIPDCSTVIVVFQTNLPSFVYSFVVNLSLYTCPINYLMHLFVITVYQPKEKFSVLFLSFQLVTSAVFTKNLVCVWHIFHVGIMTQTKENVNLLFTVDAWQMQTTSRPRTSVRKLVQVQEINDPK